MTSQCLNPDRISEGGDWDMAMLYVDETDETTSEAVQECIPRPAYSPDASMPWLAGSMEKKIGTKMENWRI
ncbi:hypothetical protein PIIN_09156 [Serendipita indica DSM 11827]|uniref:Uncharacterized protein n=1 Tax=Serendipita indica (strain DSM 11827) TaxID=1109443 RepID=G4TV29_SERID|nr:hypothetical protein PIIN_09156 [Serendipita indica DSM 11827]